MSDKFVMVPPSVNVCASTFPWVAFDDVAIGDVVMQKDGTVGQKMFAPPPHRMIRKDNGQEIPLGPFESHIYVLFSPTKKGMPTIEEKIRRTITETLLSEDFRKSFTKGLAQDILDTKIKTEAEVEAKPAEAPEPGEDFRLLKVGEIIREGDEHYNSFRGEWQITSAAHCKNAGRLVYRRRTHIWRPPTNEDLKNGPVPCRGRDASHPNWIEGLFVWKRPTSELFPYIVSKANAINSFKFCEIRVPVE